MLFAEVRKLFGYTEAFSAEDVTTFASWITTSSFDEDKN